MRTALTTILVAGLLIPTGCVTFDQKVARSAVEYNRAIEESHNRTLLLNVLRAKHRLPMVFTSISQIRGSFGNTIESGGSVTVGVGRPAVGLTPKYSASSSPSFDIAVLDSEKFMRGILASVPAQTFLYYWNAGWNKSMLAYLLIERIEITIDGKADAFKNDPDDPCELQEFTCAIKEIESWTVESGKPKSFGPGLSLSSAKDLEKLVAARSAGLDLVKYWWTYKLSIPTTEVILKGTLCAPGHEKDSDGGKREGFPFTLSEDSGSEQRKDNTGKLVLRSPQAVLYYLGELMRVGEKRVPRILTQVIPEGGKAREEPWPLFVALEKEGGTDKENKPEEWLVSVKHGDKDYGVPGPHGERPGRTMQCFALVTQLLALQKSSDELPITQAVTITGQ